MVNEKTFYEQRIATDLYFTSFLYQFSQEGFRKRFRYLAQSEQLPRYFWTADRHFRNMLWKPIMDGIKRDINALEKVKARFEQDSDFKRKIMSEYKKLKDHEGLTDIPQPNKEQTDLTD